MSTVLTAAFSGLQNFLQNPPAAPELFTAGPPPRGERGPDNLQDKKDGVILRKGGRCLACKGGGKFHCLEKTNKLAGLAFYYLRQQARRASLPFPAQAAPPGGFC